MKISEKGLQAVKLIREMKRLLSNEEELAQIKEVCKEHPEKLEELRFIGNKLQKIKNPDFNEEKKEDFDEDFDDVIQNIRSF
ncbi:hypothetical protein [Helicobacter pullorum]|uniref:Uncharacterized protein n=1 Tax=Helicobacter pullorum TaxID=35818 RepID=A0A377Q164_9HELI|nr:hypothetical protein [Helicobacter pullorum]STQ88934.1 Uncharacterised protein [Helicobacter pullorum]